ncbi:hypothetical protein, partial [Pseudomonas syringae group genomosp. 7]|uniref:hypothetical protein n=1 Tax=Pseudomonas syringae group genomosp. 7 TaxID=251699 RepID=UPI0037700DA5
EMAASFYFLFEFDASSELMDVQQYAVLSDAFLLYPSTGVFFARDYPVSLQREILVFGCV